MLGQRIADLRQKIQLSQEDLAEKVGLTQSLISRIERDSRKISATELPKFATALEVSIEDILIGVDDGE
ncbi:helix-turn-helix domain-containing protein [Chengkuizengella axinellae]|uniref:Helix-turn-helix transcriptional regulator n=1 Tax=Chengkuizengella axinellae TaxID=3064388 RepID=A0ABT9J3H1_9BACL|nr:helix-turn-helix transcriptional regulator [Chengkuizengella sp. 2205SS18-9]MDP5276143.1 helix-turn-helix transcriptional regulator [Chengkuizengella sp. 2205SS18-9]